MTSQDPNDPMVRKCIQDFFYTVLPSLALISLKPEFRKKFGTYHELGVEACYEAILALSIDKTLVMLAKSTDHYTILCEIENETIILYTQNEG